MVGLWSKDIITQYNSISELDAMIESYGDTVAINGLEENIANLEITLSDVEENLNKINAEIQLDPEGELNLGRN